MVSEILLLTGCINIFKTFRVNDILGYFSKTQFKRKFPPCKHKVIKLSKTCKVLCFNGKFL